MRISAFLMMLGLAAICAAPANACHGLPQPQYKFWAGAPQTLPAGEVALEVEFVRHPTDVEFLPTDPPKERVVLTPCDKGPIYTYRVLRVLRGEYKGPTEISTTVGGGIADELKDGQSRIVVGQLRTDTSPPFFQMRGPDIPYWFRPPPFPIPEIRLN